MAPGFSWDSKGIQREEVWLKRHRPESIDPRTMAPPYAECRMMTGDLPVPRSVRALKPVYSSDSGTVRSSYRHSTIAARDPYIRLLGEAVGKCRQNTRLRHVHLLTLLYV